VRVARRTGIAVAAVCAVLPIVACTSEAPVATPSQSAWTEQPSTTATPSPTATRFDGRGSAADNLPIFDAVNRATLAAHPDADGTTVTQALIAAGFPRSSMQVSASKTSANLTPGSISVGVRVGDCCLVGQWGSAVDGYHSAVTTPLSTGACLVGGTAPVR
jgi:hypothetical protein